MKIDLRLPFAVVILYTACVILSAPLHTLRSPAAQEADLIQRMFGGLRVFVGDWAFMKAEEYHHRGLTFDAAAGYHEGESPLSAHEERAEPAGAAAQKGVTLYERLRDAVKVTKDSHLKPEEEKEVLPWFYVETAFNPHDARGYILGSYWLDRIGKHGESMKFLAEGERKNPGSAQILSAIGQAYLKDNDLPSAKKYLERSVDLWRSAKGDNAISNKYAESDRDFSYDLLASIYTKEGDYAGAAVMYEELLKFRANPVILKKLDAIRARGSGAKDDNNQAKRT